METLSRREFMKISSALMPAAFVGNKLMAGTGNSSDDRPNIIFVFADQMRAHAMGCMGNELDLRDTG